MSNDLISREYLEEQFNGVPDSEDKDIALMLIDNAPTVEEKSHYEFFATLLNKRIVDSVCKYCSMNNHCELCEISRVFSIIALTDKEMKGGAE